MLNLKNMSYTVLSAGAYTMRQGVGGARSRADGVHLSSLSAVGPSWQSTHCGLLMLLLACRLWHVVYKRSGPRIARVRNQHTQCHVCFGYMHVPKRKKRNHRSRQPRRKWASALQGAGVEGQHRATPTRAAAPEAPPD